MYMNLNNILTAKAAQNLGKFSLDDQTKLSNAMLTMCNYSTCNSRKTESAITRGLTMTQQTLMSAKSLTLNTEM